LWPCLRPRHAASAAAGGRGPRHAAGPAAAPASAATSATSAPALGHRGLVEGAKDQHCCENEADLLEHPRSPRRRKA
jgi:hypothetical protein